MDIVLAVVVLLVVIGALDRIANKGMKFLTVSTAFSGLIALLFHWGTTV